MTEEQFELLRQVQANFFERVEARRKWNEALMLLKDRMPHNVLVDLFYLGEGHGGVIEHLNRMTDEDLTEWVDAWNADV